MLVAQHLVPLVVVLAAVAVKGNMGLESFLEDHREELKLAWGKSILGSYPGQSQRFLNKDVDQFANPLAHSLKAGISELFDLLMEGANAEQLSPVLSDMIKITSLKEGQPSKSLAFLFQLKQVAYKMASQAENADEILKDYVMLDRLVDQLIRLGFDIYAKIKEELLDIKGEELKQQVYSLMKHQREIVGLPTEH